MCSTAPTAAANVQLMVYYHAGAFPDGTVTTTPCGLSNYATSEAASGHMAAGVDATSVTIGGLLPSTEYQVVVVANCLGDCHAQEAADSRVAYPSIKVKRESERCGAKLVDNIH